MDGAGITDITGLLEAYWHNRPDAEFANETRPQANLWFTRSFDTVQGGNPTLGMSNNPATRFDHSGTDTSTGYSLTTYTTDGTGGGAFGFYTTKPWGATQPAGVYCFSVDVMSTADTVLTLQYTYAGHDCQVAFRRIVGDGLHHRYDYSFYFPGGGASFTFAGSASHLSASTTMSFGLFKIEPGRHATAYTAPVDDADTPTTNVTSPLVLSRYYASARPATGDYIVGDEVINNVPTPGGFASWRCISPSSGGVGAIFLGVQLPVLTPSDLSGLVADWDASFKTLTGGNVSALQDQSGNGNHIGDPGVGKRPLWIASEPLFNNFPAFETDGVDDLLQWLGTLVQPFTVFLVHDAVVLDSGAGTHDVIFDGGTGVTAFVQDVTQSLISAGTALVDTDNPTAGTAHYVTAVFNSGTSKLRIDGVEKASGNAGGANAGGITIGALHGPTRWSHTKYTRIVVVRGILNTVATEGIELYLKTKYAL